MKVWITSDTHFDHLNIIRYCDRPFNTLNEMRDYIIEQWNKCVSDDDIIIFCGDFCFARSSEKKEMTEFYTRQLKGHKIIVKGNHDFKQLRYRDLGWDDEYYQEWIFNNRFSFRHRPDDIYHDAEKFDFIFYGHVHDKVIGDAPVNTINVCQDVHVFRPIDITNYFTSNELILLQKSINLDSQK